MKQDDVNRMIANISSVLATRIGMESQGKYKFSRKWYQAHFDSQYYFEVDAWCSQQFGPHPARPDAWSRWWHKFEDSILFRDEKDYTLFLLRWGV